MLYDKEENKVLIRVKGHPEIIVLTPEMLDKWDEFEFESFFELNEYIRSLTDVL